MLVKFSVKNYKQFKDEITFDLSAGNYEFNNECVKNGVVKTALIYGQNGTGKTNIGQAIFHSVLHLTNRFSSENIKNSFIANGFAVENDVKFELVFKLFGKELIYRYTTNANSKILFEELIIEGKEVIRYELNKPFVTNLKNTEHLNKELNSMQNLSSLMYILNNSNLDIDDLYSKIFIEFMSFVEDMIWTQNMSEGAKILGYTNSNGKLAERIIKSGNLQNFENFLNESGVECKLKAVEYFNNLTIVFDFNGFYIPFKEISSTGTKHLSQLFFWLLEIEERKVPLFFIDEFDASYHHELSFAIVEKLKQLKNTQVILTTHNTSLLDNDLIRPDCGFIIDGKQIKSLQYCTKRELRQAHNLEKMYKAGAFRVR